MAHEAREVLCRRVRRGDIRAVIHSRRVEEKCSLHEERSRQGVHVSDKVTGGVQPLGVCDPCADVVGECVGGDIV